jgi:hypothetical protein
MLYGVNVLFFILELLKSLIACELGASREKERIEMVFGNMNTLVPLVQG